MYSNIHYLQCRVQGYSDALKATIKELESFKKTNILALKAYRSVVSRLRGSNRIMMNEAKTTSKRMMECANVHVN